MKKTNVLYAAGIAALLVLAASCAQGAGTGSSSTAQTTVVAPAKTLADVAYGTATVQTMDVYVPSGGGGNKGVVILVHGGAWVGGGKADLSAQAKAVSDRGYVTVNMNYRLANTLFVLTPDANTTVVSKMVDDIESVKAYVAAHAAEWGCDANKIALVGASSGAHLALMDTLTKNTAGTIKACVSLSGPTDFTDETFQNNSMTITTGGSAQTFKVIYGLQLAVGMAWNKDDPTVVAAFRAASPRWQDLSKATAVKFLFVHGKVDTLVPYAQAEALKDALIKAGTSADWYLSDTDGHDLANCIASVTLTKVFPLLDASLR